MSNSARVWNDCSAAQLCKGGVRVFFSRPLHELSFAVEAIPTGGKTTSVERLDTIGMLSRVAGDHNLAPLPRLGKRPFPTAVQLEQPFSFNEKKKTAEDDMKECKTEPEVLKAGDETASLDLLLCKNSPPHTRIVARPTVSHRRLVMPEHGGTMLEPPPVATVNRQCSSGLTAVNQIAGQIALGQIDIGIVIALRFPKSLSFELLSVFPSPAMQSNRGISGRVPGQLDASQPSRVLHHPQACMEFMDAAALPGGLGIYEAGRRIVFEFLPGATCGTWRLVSQPTFRSGADSEESSQWPRVISICGFVLSISP
ncbi:hypothetical protein K488DRAFT_73977 [Vararia minispora EC-137]|uniref:Uncharacterized protein n=1 Tax=Vararia minispora EC-137 TaxID=1314806 RepID=A0ACB8Q9A7_9AGAM|nr:hypothetical protein K488DRAFT_73977 [Vararia minispora EC-137]